MSYRPRRRTLAASAAVGLALSMGAPAAVAQSSDQGLVSVGSIGGFSVAAGEKAGLGSATGSLPGQCSALGFTGSGERGMTRAVPGDNSGETAFLVDINMVAEGSTATENVEIHWKNLDTEAEGTVDQSEIGWIDLAGQRDRGVIVDTGPGTIEWTMTADEVGAFLPTLSLGALQIPTGSESNPYGGCGGTVVVP